MSLFDMLLKQSGLQVLCQRSPSMLTLPASHLHLACRRLWVFAIPSTKLHILWFLVRRCHCHGVWHHLWDNGTLCSILHVLLTSCTRGGRKNGLLQSFQMWWPLHWSKARLFSSGHKSLAAWHHDCIDMLQETVILNEEGQFDTWNEMKLAWFIKLKGLTLKEILVHGSWRIDNVLRQPPANEHDAMNSWLILSNWQFFAPVPMNMGCSETITIQHKKHVQS